MSGSLHDTTAQLIAKEAKMDCQECGKQAGEGQDFCDECTASLMQLKDEIAKASSDLKKLQNEHIRRTGVRHVA